MRRLSMIVMVLGFILCGLPRGGRAEGPPATQPAFGVSEMRVQTIAGFTYLYDSSETTLARMADPVGRMLPALMRASAEGKVRPAGPIIMMYHDLKDLSQPFTLDVGCSAQPDTKPVGTFKVRKVEPFRCATVLFTGPIKHIGEAYQKLVADLDGAHLTTTGTSREFYLYWEGPDSPNNVVQIQMGIQ